MKRISVLLIATGLIFTSCMVTKPMTTYKKGLHNQAQLVKPSWEIKRAQSTDFLPIAGGVAAAAYGYYSPSLVVNEKKMTTGMNTTIYAIGGVILTRYITNFLFPKSISRKYKKKQAQKWVSDLNSSTNSNYVIAKDFKYRNDLIIVPQNKIQDYFKGEEELRIKGDSHHVLIKSELAKELKLNVGKEQIKIREVSLISDDKKTIFDIRDDNTVYAVSPKYKGTSSTRFTPYEAKLDGKNVLFLNGYNTYSQKEEDYILSKNGGIYNLTIITDGKVSNRIFKELKNPNLNLSKNSKSVYHEFASILKFEESFFATTVTDCNQCANCNFTTGSKKVQFNTISVFCDEKLIKKYKLYEIWVCNEESTKITSEDGDSFNASGRREAWEILKTLGAELCPNSVIRYE